jgi:hypothetical protein
VTATVGAMSEATAGTTIGTGTIATATIISIITETVTTRGSASASASTTRPGVTRRASGHAEIDCRCPITVPAT